MCTTKQDLSNKCRLIWWTCPVAAKFPIDSVKSSVYIYAYCQITNNWWLWIQPIIGPLAKWNGSCIELPIAYLRAGAPFTNLV